MIKLLLDMQQQIARVEGTQIVLAGQNATAAESRARIHTKLDTLDGRMSNVENKQLNAAETIQLMQPDVQDWVRTRSNLRVGLAILGAVGLALVSMIGWLATVVFKAFLTYLPGWPKL